MTDNPQNDQGSLGPAYIQPFYCSICRSHLGNMVCHTLEDAKEIYDLCLAKKTGMMCLQCSLKYSLKEGYYDIQDNIR